MNEIYMDELIEIYRNPKNYGEIKGEKVRRITAVNPTCGDVIHLSVKIENDKVEDAKFKGEGCLISQVYADKFIDFIRGKNLNSIKEIKSQDVLNLLPISLNAGRIKCALLCYNAFKKLSDEND